MAETIGNTFGVGGTSYSDSPYTAPSRSGSGGDAPWWQAVLSVGERVLDQAWYTEQEKARDQLAARNRQRQIDAQAAVGIATAEAQTQSQKTMMIALAGVGAVVAVAMIAS